MYAVYQIRPNSEYVAVELKDSWGATEVDSVLPINVDWVGVNASSHTMAINEVKAKYGEIYTDPDKMVALKVRVNNLSSQSQEYFL